MGEREEKEEKEEKEAKEKRNQGRPSSSVGAGQSHAPAILVAPVNM